MSSLGVATSGESVPEWWTGVLVPGRDGHAQFGDIPSHGCRVLVLPHAVGG